MRELYTMPGMFRLPSLTAQSRAEAQPPSAAVSLLQLTVTFPPGRQTQRGAQHEPLTSVHGDLVQLGVVHSCHRTRC